MIKDIELIISLDVCFTIHPFKRDGKGLPFTMVSCLKNKTQADHMLFLNHEKKEFYIVPNKCVSEYNWIGENLHRLHFIAGVDKIYTVVHENVTQGLIKVPCCYEHPDYLIGGEPNFKLLEAENFLCHNHWKKRVAHKSNDDYILNLVKEKIDINGVSGGKYIKKE